MNQLIQAYKIIFGKDPENLEPWQLAKAVTENFNVPKLGQELAKQILKEIISNIIFPNIELTKEVVGHAENLLTEFTSEFGDEPHYAAVEASENRKKYKQ